MEFKLPGKNGNRYLVPPSHPGLSHVDQRERGGGVIMPPKITEQLILIQLNGFFQRDTSVELKITRGYT